MSNYGEWAELRNIPNGALFEDGNDGVFIKTEESHDNYILCIRYTKGSKVWLKTTDRAREIDTGIEW